MIKRFRFSPGLAAVFLIGSLPGSCRAALIFDQGFDPTGQITLSSSFGGINSNQDIAQSFQVGMNGTLGEVDLYLHRFTATPVGGNLVFELRRLTGTGLPSNAPGDSLLQILIPSTNVGTTNGFLDINVSSANLQVTAGEGLAIVLHADSGTPSNLTYIWAGQNNNPYANGMAFEQVVGNHSWDSITPTADLGFRTYLTTSAVPEPGSITLGAIGALFLVGYRWRKRTKSSRLAENGII